MIIWTFLLILFGYGLVSVVQLQTNTHNNNADPESGVCRQLSSNDSSKRLKILCVGLLPKRILLITDNLDVFELELDSLQHTINQLYIQAKPEQLSKKWPVLYNDTRFKLIVGKVYNAFTVTDNTGQYVLFTTKKDLYPDLEGVTYDLTNAKVYPGLYYKNRDDQVLLSTDSQLTFYALHQNGGGLEMATYKFRDSRVVGDDINIDRISDWRRLCQGDGDGQSTIFSEPSKDARAKGKQQRCKPVNWPVLKGFVFRGQFFLFGTDYVFLFAQTVYTGTNNDSDSSKVRKISYNGFIHCAGNIGLLKVDYKKNTMLGIIIAVVLIVLLFCLVAALFIRKKINDRKKRNKKKGTGSQEKQAKKKALGAGAGAVGAGEAGSERNKSNGVAGGQSGASHTHSNRSSMSQLPKVGQLSRQQGGEKKNAAEKSSQRLSGSISKPRLSASKPLVNPERSSQRLSESNSKPRLSASKPLVNPAEKSSQRLSGSNSKPRLSATKPLVNPEKSSQRLSGSNSKPRLSASKPLVNPEKSSQRLSESNSKPRLSGSKPRLSTSKPNVAISGHSAYSGGASQAATGRSGMSNIPAMNVVGENLSEKLSGSGSKGRMSTSRTATGGAGQSSFGGTSQAITGRSAMSNHTNQQTR